MEVHGSSGGILRAGLLIGAALTGVLEAMAFVECSRLAGSTMHQAPGIRWARKFENSSSIRMRI